ASGHFLLASRAAPRDNPRTLSIHRLGERAMTTAAPASAPEKDQLPRSIWRAPLVPVALAVTAGIVVDRYAPLPLLVSLVAAAAFLLAYLIAHLSTRSGLPFVYLALALAALGAAHHHYQRSTYPPDDIGNFAPATPRPALL